MDNPEQISIVWSDYMKYRANLRGFNLKKIEDILRYSEERYFDNVTQRKIVVGRHGRLLIMIPYDQSRNNVSPVTIHATTRQQINFRLKTGRIIHE